MLIPDAHGKLVPAATIKYNGAPTGYSDSPSETVNYLSAHDNQTLFDAMQLKSPDHEPVSARARRQMLAMSVVALAQGIPFFAEADDLLRSKDMDADSFNSGNWFNRIDWRGATDNWGTGLPPVAHNQGQRKFDRLLLQDPTLKPTPRDMHLAEAVFAEFLRIRCSSPLFRMQTAQQIASSLHFIDASASSSPGVIVYVLESKDKTGGPYRQVLVVINATTEQQAITDRSLIGHPLFFIPSNNTPQMRDHERPHSILNLALHAFRRSQRLYLYRCAKCRSAIGVDRTETKFKSSEVGSTYCTFSDYLACKSLNLNGGGGGSRIEQTR